MERAIINDDQENFDRLLGEINFDDLSTGQIEQFFRQVFEQLASYNRPALLAILSDHWDSVYGNVLHSEAPLSLQSWLFTQNIPLEILRSIHMPDISLINVVGNLLDFDDTPAIFAAVLRAIDYFQGTNEYTYRLLLQLCGENNKFIRNALIIHLVTISEFAPIPSWVSQEWLSEQEVFARARKRRAELADNIEERLQDPEMFRLLGPPNSNGQREERMFASITYDWDEEYFDWFDGYCENCYRRIRSREHSVRSPMLYGGWEGCFCSFRCLIEQIEQEDNLDEIIFRLEIVKALKPRLQTVGILAREENPPERAALEEIDIDAIVAKYLPSQDMVDNIRKISTRQDFENLFVSSCENLHEFAYQEGANIIAGYRDAQQNIICQFDRPIVVLIAKRNCPYCIRFKPWFVSQAQKEARVDFAQLYDDQPAFPSVVQQFAVRQFPTVLVFPPLREGQDLLVYTLQDSEKIKEDLPLVLSNI